MTEHIKTRSKLKEIPRVTTLMELLDECTLSDDDKQIIIMHYVQDKDFGFIADTLGFSRSAVEKRHRKILRKIGKII